MKRRANPYAAATLASERKPRIGSVEIWIWLFRRRTVILATLAVAAIHGCLLLFFVFAAEGVSWAAWTETPILVLSLPLLTVWEWTGADRWANESLQMSVVLLNSLVWGLAVSLLGRAIGKRVL